MKHLIPSLLLAALAATQPAEAVEAVAVFGTQDCGQWLRNPNKNWLAGYLSGMNASYASEDFDPLLQINSFDQAALWIDNYCRSNPLDNVQRGSNRLYGELRDRLRKSRQ